MMKRTKRLLIATVLVFSCFFSPAARSQEFSAEDLNAASDGYAERFLRLEEWLATGRSPEQDLLEREKMLRTIDEPFAHPEALKLQCVAEFFQTRMNAFIENFSRTNVDKGVIVWKLYNHTAIIQTRDIKIGIDIYSGYEAVKMNPDVLSRIVNSLDVLLVTHVHADHTDRQTVDMFVQAGKPVVMPYLFWPDYEHNDKLTVMRSGELDFKGAKVRVFPSMQKSDQDNVYLITAADGYTVMHLGDENEFNTAGHEWFRKLKQPMDIDILIPNIWCPDIASLLKYVRPKLVMASHEHELGHPVEGRRSYDYVYKVLNSIRKPYIVPAWGEPVRWPRVQDAAAN